MTDNGIDLYSDICNASVATPEQPHCEVKARCEHLEQEQKVLMEAISGLAQENRTLLASNEELKRQLAELKKYYEQKLKFLHERHDALARRGSSSTTPEPGAVKRAFDCRPFNGPKTPPSPLPPPVSASSEKCQSIGTPDVSGRGPPDAAQGRQDPDLRGQRRPGVDKQKRLPADLRRHHNGHRRLDVDLRGKDDAQRRQSAGFQGQEGGLRRQEVDVRRKDGGHRRQDADLPGKDNGQRRQDVDLQDKDGEQVKHDDLQKVEGQSGFGSEANALRKRQQGYSGKQCGERRGRSIEKGRTDSEHNCALDKKGSRNDRQDGEKHRHRQDGEKRKNDTEVHKKSDEHQQKDNERHRQHSLKHVAEEQRSMVPKMQVKDGEKGNNNSERRYDERHTQDRRGVSREKRRLDSEKHKHFDENHKRSYEMQKQKEDKDRHGVKKRRHSDEKYDQGGKKHHQGGERQKQSIENYKVSDEKCSQASEKLEKRKQSDQRHNPKRNECSEKGTQNDEKLKQCDADSKLGDDNDRLRHEKCKQSDKKSRQSNKKHKMRDEKSREIGGKDKRSDEKDSRSDDKRTQSDKNSDDRQQQSNKSSCLSDDRQQQSNKSSCLSDESRNQSDAKRKLSNKKRNLSNEEHNAAGTECKQGTDRSVSKKRVEATERGSQRKVQKDANRPQQPDDSPTGKGSGRAAGVSALDATQADAVYAKQSSTDTEPTVRSVRTVPQAALTADECDCMTEEPQPELRQRDAEARGDTCSLLRMHRSWAATEAARLQFLPRRWPQLGDSVEEESQKSQNQGPDEQPQHEETSEQLLDAQVDELCQPVEHLYEQLDEPPEVQLYEQLDVQLEEQVAEFGGTACDSDTDIGRNLLEGIFDKQDCDSRESASDVAKQNVDSRNASRRKRRSSPRVVAAKCQRLH